MNFTFRIAGVIVPMVSPFTADERVDAPAVGRVVEYLIAGGIAGIFVLGTTGEAASISSAQKRELVKATARCAGNRAIVYAGVSGNCLAESIDAARAYRDLGASAVVAHPPYYFKVAPSALVAYFQRLADAIPLPLVLYNIPQTTGVSLELDSIEKLSQHPNIAGIKDSSRDADRLSALIARCGRADFSVLLGSSKLYAQGLRLGAGGIVPSGANLWPQLHQALYDAAVRQEWDELDRLAEEIRLLTDSIHEGRLLAESLAALKAMMAQRGLCGPTVLPPLRNADDRPAKT